jgi:1,4-alpha-glucan branching enzyme
MRRMQGQIRAGTQLKWRFTKISICCLCTVVSAVGLGSPIEAARAESGVTTDGRLPLGAIYTSRQTTFSIWSPDSDDVKLSLEGQPAIVPLAKLPDTDQYSDVFRAIVPGDHHLKRYNFLINGKAVRDPYGVMVDPATNNNIVMDLSKTELEGGWATLPTLAQREDAVIYELNVHDYTADASSGVSPEKRGKFLGLVEHGTHVDGRSEGPPSGIDHLVDLGITHVQIMPIFDYSSCPHRLGRAVTIGATTLRTTIFRKNGIRSFPEPTTSIVFVN